jgi:hypothetical protein
MFDNINQKDLGSFAVALFLAGFGGLAAFLQAHEGKGLTARQFLKGLISNLVVAMFAGTVAALLCKTLNLGVWESCVTASMAGFAHKDALKWFKERFRKGVQP